MHQHPYRGLSALCLSAALLAVPAFAGNYAVAPNEGMGVYYALSNPNMVPPGANPASCNLAQHPYPVVLVNGTFSVMEDDFGGLAPHLANDGYCVYTFNYGAPYYGSFVEATGSVPASAGQLAGFVSQVLGQTGASKVDLIGHSQGGMLAEYYAKIDGGAPLIHNLIGLSPTTHGTTLNGFAVAAQYFPGANLVVGGGCQACVDQESGSPVIQQLDNGPIAQPGVNYTIIETQYEYVVTPVGSSFINEPGVTNEYVQSSCGNDFVDHGDLSYDNVVFQLIENVLTPATAKAPNCAIAYPMSAQ